MQPAATRWGIAGAGKISHDFALAIATLPSNDHKIVAVAARESSRAKRFASAHGIKNAYGRYNDLAQDPEVEIVYVGTLHPQHLEVAKLMLENGKHVLCEKPMTMNGKQTSELIAAANERGLFLMEAIWSRCFPAYAAMKDAINSGAIGDVKQVIASFGFDLSDVDRLRCKEQGGGSILDLGVYTIQFASFVFNAEKPKSIKAAGHLNEEGVDKTMSATLLYDNDRVATIATNMTVNLPNEAWVIGTKGTIKMPFFWCPTSCQFPAGNFHEELPKSSGKFNYVNSAGLAYEASEARECITAGAKESSKLPHAESLVIAEIQDEMRRQIGVVYDVD